MNSNEHSRQSTLSKLAAFTQDPKGGNPAGVWLGETLPKPEEMQKIARDVGYSETVFIAPLQGTNKQVRYYSPEAEVPFCGHATIAAGVALSKSDMHYTFKFETAVGEIPLEVQTKNGIKQASLTSVDSKFEPAEPKLLAAVLEALAWSKDDISMEIPAAKAFAGNWHLVIAVKAKSRLDELQYDFDRLKQIMLDEDLTTLQLVWRETETIFHSRNPFPVGGVVEDPATGAAAAALGAYLRDARLINTPKSLILRQGEVMGRPSKLSVDIPNEGGVKISGTAVEIIE